MIAVPVLKHRFVHVPISGQEITIGTLWGQQSVMMFLHKRNRMEKINLRQWDTDTQARSISKHTGTQIYTLKKTDTCICAKTSRHAWAHTHIYTPDACIYVSPTHVHTHRRALHCYWMTHSSLCRKITAEIFNYVIHNLIIWQVMTLCWDYVLSSSALLLFISRTLTAVNDTCMHGWMNCLHE